MTPIEKVHKAVLELLPTIFKETLHLSTIGYGKFALNHLIIEAVEKMQSKRVFPGVNIGEESFVFYRLIDGDKILILTSEKELLRSIADNLSNKKIEEYYERGN
jgi:hypothetical protein